MRRVLAVGLLLLAGCDRGAAPAPNDDARATAAAEHKAVADTDAAEHDAAAVRPVEQN